MREGRFRRHDPGQWSGLLAVAGWQVRFEVPAVADSRFTQGSVDGVEKSCLALAAESHLCAGCCDL